MLRAAARERAEREAEAGDQGAADPTSAAKSPTGQSPAEQTPARQQQSPGPRGPGGWGEAAARSPHGLPWSERWDVDLRAADPLGFAGYQPPEPDRESVRAGVVRLSGQDVVLIECSFDRQGGTMGTVAGERIVRAFRRATERRLPVVELVASGGARLQEGMFSLVQMARTASAAAEHGRAGLLSAAVLGRATTGGVYASWASLADLRAAYPGSTVGFAGPRVVAQVTGAYPPASSHTAESAYDHGLLDALVEPAAQLDWLAAALGITPAPPILLEPGRPTPADLGPDAADPADPDLDSTGERPGTSGLPLNAGWAAVRRARAPRRPSGLEWAAWLTGGWVELRGPDPAIRAGLAQLGGGRVMVVAMDRFATGTHGHPGPDAFRLAQRAIRLAGRLGLPVLTLIDTPGADPSPDSEAGGVAGEIARTLLAMAELPTASVALTVGEGGSGGAMALAHADRFLMLEGAVFSVIGPEPGAAILYRDADRAPGLAAAFRLRSGDLAGFGIADAVLPERLPAVRDAVVAALGTARPGDRVTRPARVTRSTLTERAG